jgi:O-succinylbenzoate synthase
MDLLSSITVAKLFYYRLPFASPLNFNGEKLSSREGLLLQLQDNHNQLSYGEIAPLPGFSRENLQQAKTQIIALLESGLDNLQQSDNLHPSVCFALDMALQQIPLGEKAVSLDTVPLLQGNNQQLIKQYRNLQRPSLIKLKVARQKVAEDIELFTKLGELNPHLKIRADANQLWSNAQSDYFFTHINKHRLDYIEEPTASHRANLQLAQKHQIALALDESLQNSHFNYQHHACIKALVLKPTLIGSASRLQHFIDIAMQQQLQVHISSSFESIVGLQQLTALANRYQKKCRLSLGIDTLKYYRPGLLTDIKQLPKDLQKLECLWSSN